MYQTDEYHPQTDIDRLLKNLQNLIDGNQATISDLSISDWSASTFSLVLSVDWTFFGQSDKQVKAGNHKQDICFANQQELDNHHQNLMNEASFGKSLRQDFLQNIQALNKEALFEYQQTHTFHYFEPFSVYEDCASCHASGMVQCHDCHGRGQKSCSYCGGGGRESYQTPIYDNKNQIRGYQTQYRSCSACFGSGTQRCNTCGGKGQITCNNCSGHGFFTHIYQIKAQAKPNFHISHNNPFEPDIFSQILDEKGVEFCAKHIDLTLAEENEIDQEVYQFVYKGQSIAFDILLMMKQKSFNCVAFSSPPYAYVRPYLFDELFANEWQFLKNAQDNQGNISKKEAQLFFLKYMNQPILDNALKNIAQNNHTPKKSVQLACQDYISADMANNIGQSLLHILDKVSPTHSKLAWIICALPAGLWLWVASIYHIQTASGIFSSIIYIIKSMLQSLPIILLFALIAWLLSRLFVFIVNQKIPKEYRQSANNTLMLRYYMIAMGGVLALAISYAILADKGYLPFMSDDWYISLMALKDKLPF